MSVKLGIDVSYHNGDIDLATLASNGVEFVIIRVGYGVSGTIDKQFTNNVNKCINNNIPFGFYWYSYALDTDGAKKEAEACINAIAAYKNNYSYGVWFDMEDADGYKSKNGMPSNATLVNICETFCNTLHDAGYYTGVYASQSWFNNQLKNFSGHDTWIAQWPTSGGNQTALNTSSSKRSSNMWQFTSKAQFTGYSGYLDADYAYEDYPSLCAESSSQTSTNTNTNTTSSEVVAVETVEVQKFAIGDKVIINGPLYKSSTATTASGTATNKTTNITRYASGAAHPYNTTGDLGWMDESSITAASTTTTSATTTTDNTITKGCKVKFTGTKSYSGVTLASWVTGYTFTVIEVSGDRVVIGKGSSVTAAVNINDCVKV